LREAIRCLRVPDGHPRVRRPKLQHVPERHLPHHRVVQRDVCSVEIHRRKLIVDNQRKVNVICYYLYGKILWLYRKANVVWKESGWNGNPCSGLGSVPSQTSGENNLTKFHAPANCNLMTAKIFHDWKINWCTGLRQKFCDKLKKFNDMSSKRHKLTTYH